MNNSERLTSMLDTVTWEQRKGSQQYENQPATKRGEQLYDYHSPHGSPVRRSHRTSLLLSFAGPLTASATGSTTGSITFLLADLLVAEAGADFGFAAEGSRQ